MNSYTLTDKLRKARRRHTISAGAQALFYEIVSINNEENWSDVFRCSNGELTGSLNISENTLTAYRDELINAGLLSYESGKSKRLPGHYSLNGSSIGVANGVRIGVAIGSKFCGSTTSKSEDYNKQEETKTKTIDVDDDKAREFKIESAITDFCSDVNTEEQKEKKVAPKKEKSLPSILEVVAEMNTLTYWRLVLEHHNQSTEERAALFKIFYEQKEDNYRIRLPTWTDMAQHFYNWVPIHLQKGKLMQLNKSVTQPKSAFIAAVDRTNQRLSKYQNE